MDADKLQVNMDIPDGPVREASIDDRAFEILEKDHNELVQELMGDHRLDMFRLEYEKLHKSLKKSHQSETRLVSKCRELNAEIVANSAKVLTAHKLSEEDEGVISKLKTAVQKEWKKVDEAHEREFKSKEIIASLKSAIYKVTDRIELGGGLTIGQKLSLNKILKVKEELTKDRDSKLAGITKQREQLAEAGNQIAQLEVDTAKTEKDIQELNRELQTYHNEIQKETLKKERYQRELIQVKADLNSKSEDITLIQGQMKSYEFDIQKLEQNVKEKKVLCERINQGLELSHDKYNKLSEDYELRLISADTLTAENHAKNLELKIREEELEVMKAEAQKLNKAKDIITKRIRNAEDGLVDVEQQRESFKSQMLFLEQHLEFSKKKSESDKKNIEDLIRERDTLGKNLLKAVSTTQKQLHLVKLHSHSKHKLEQEINKFKVEAQTQRKVIFQLERERDRYISETSELTQRVLVHMEEVKEREMLVFNFKKKIAECKTKMKQQQNLYDAVSSDRNLYTKNLLESQEEIGIMKSKLITMNHVVEQLKEEIQQKEASLVKEYLQSKRVDKEKDAIKEELMSVKKRAADMDDYIESQEAEENKLLRIIAEADREKFCETKELNQVITERDILGQQLMQRIDELRVLYEEIKTKQSVLNKGEVQYNQRLEDIRVLKLEMKKLRSENLILEKRTANNENIRREVFNFRRVLLHKRTQCRALEEELANPMNVHRWRKLEGSDISTYDMIVKIHILQKQLIHKTEELEEKELLIQENEKLYLELKNILARQPGPEVAEQLQIYQGTLNDKNKQMKALQMELDKYDSQVHEYKTDLKRIQVELQKLRASYFAQKRKEMKIWEHNKILEKRGVASI